jgi:hypothetical protein
MKYDFICMDIFSPKIIGTGALLIWVQSTKIEGYSPQNALPIWKKS